MKQKRANAGSFAVTGGTLLGLLGGGWGTVRFLQWSWASNYGCLLLLAALTRALYRSDSTRVLAYALAAAGYCFAVFIAVMAALSSSR